MKKSPLYYAGYAAAALIATAFSWSAALAAGSVEDLKPAAASAVENLRPALPVRTAAEADKPFVDRAAAPGRTAFDEFSVIGDPLYRRGSIEFLKKAVEAGKEEKPAEAKDKAVVPGAEVVKDGDVPAFKKARPAKTRPSDLRDAPSDTRKVLPLPRIKAPARKSVPADPVAPRKAS